MPLLKEFASFRKHPAAPRSLPLFVDSWPRSRRFLAETAIVFGYRFNSVKLADLLRRNFSDYEVKSIDHGTPSSGPEGPVRVTVADRDYHLPR